MRQKRKNQSATISEKIDGASIPVARTIPVDGRTGSG